MAFFLPRAAFNPACHRGGQHAARNDFAPLWSLIDDTFNDLTRTAARSGSGAVESFSPRFDVRETKDAYALEGELPGIEQKDVSIEFVDEHTLTIKGRTERQQESGTPGEQQQPAAIKDKPSSSPHRATVEDENEDGANKEQPSTEVATAAKQTESEAAKPQKQQQPHHQYWVSERHVGSFERTFNFPARVDQDTVKASLKNGILSIVVPKAKATQSRRVAIE